MRLALAVKRRAPTALAAFLVASVVAVPLAVVPSASASAAPALDLKARVLTRSDLPAGWHAARARPTPLDLASTPCLRGLDAKRPAGERSVTESFFQGSGLPALSESLVVGESTAGYEEALDALARCRRLTLTVGAKRVNARITGITLPVRGTASRAFSLALTATHVPIGADIVIFRTPALIGEVVYVGVGTPTSVTARALVQVSVSKAIGQAVHPPAMVSVVSAPAKVVHTAMGDVGYREVGSGLPLVLIMGFSGSMETWDPRFVDALAHDYEVVIFDNAGIGRTQALPAPLTIDKMANQTSALIRALGLNRPDVLGWSMGSMIAEALAVLHPAQVDRLVLCAAYPGTGALEPTQQAIADLTRGTPAQVRADLFPADQLSAATGYEVSLSDWPASPSTPSGVVSAQEKAITTWWAGRDPAGRRASAISSPTFILDGTADRLDPQPNAHRLQSLIHGALLSLYPDAGHAFLFQEETTVVPAIESFLRGTGASGPSTGERR